MTIPKFEIKYKNYNFLAESKEAMYLNIKKFLDNKNIAFDEKELRAHLDKCLKVNSAYSGGTSDAQEKRLNKVYVPRLKFKDVVNGAKALLGTSLGHTVDQEEITRRGRICAGCPNKTLTTDCYGCGFAGTLNKFIIGLKSIFAKEVSIHPDVKGCYCNVCSCALAIMIPSELTAFNEDEEKQSKRPDFCWLKRSGDNYNP